MRHDVDIDMDSEVFRRRSIIGPHTCRSLILGVLLLGAMALKKANDTREENTKALEKEKLHKLTAELAQPNSGKFGGLDKASFPHQGQFPGKDHLYKDRLQGHYNDLGNLYSDTAAFGASSKQPGAGTTSHAALMLLGIAVGAIFVWFLLVMGIRRLRQWASGSEKIEEGLDDERVPLTKVQFRQG